MYHMYVYIERVLCIRVCDIILVCMLCACCVRCVSARIARFDVIILLSVCLLNGM